MSSGSSIPETVKDHLLHFFLKLITKSVERVQETTGMNFTVGMISGGFLVLGGVVYKTWLKIQEREEAFMQLLIEYERQRKAAEKLQRQYGEHMRMVSEQNRVMIEKLRVMSEQNRGTNEQLRLVNEQNRAMIEVFRKYLNHIPAEVLEAEMNQHLQKNPEQEQE